MGWILLRRYFRGSHGNHRMVCSQQFRVGETMVFLDRIVQSDLRFHLGTPDIFALSEASSRLAGTALGVIGNTKQSGGVMASYKF